MSDSSVHWPQCIKDAANWANNNIVKPIRKNIANRIYKKVEPALKFAADIANYDVNNDSEESVIASNYFSSYKGATVVKIGFMDKNAFSFGVLFIGDEVNNSNTIKNEYGHYLQYEELGFNDYMEYVGIPSLKGFWGGVPHEKYYSQPWEYGVDLYGGVVRYGYVYDEDAEDNFKIYWDSIGE